MELLIRTTQILSACVNGLEMPTNSESSFQKVISDRENGRQLSREVIGGQSTFARFSTPTLRPPNTTAIRTRHGTRGPSPTSKSSQPSPAKPAVTVRQRQFLPILLQSMSSLLSEVSCG